MQKYKKRPFTFQKNNTCILHRKTAWLLPKLHGISMVMSVKKRVMTILTSQHDMIGAIGFPIQFHVIPISSLYLHMISKIRKFILKLSFSTHKPQREPVDKNFSEQAPFTETVSAVGNKVFYSFRSFQAKLEKWQNLLCKPVWLDSSHQSSFLLSWQLEHVL